MAGAGKIFRFWATVPSGLVEVALDEMHEVLTGVQIERLEKGRVQTRVFFTYERSPLRLLQVHSAFAIYAVLADMRGITVGKPGLERMAGLAAKIDLAAAQRLGLACNREVAADAFQLHATVQGNHRFGPSEVVKALQAALVQSGSLRLSHCERGLSLQVQVRGRSAVLGLRLSARQGRKQSAVGYCLGRMVGLESGDRVLWLRRDRGEAVELVRSFGVDLYAGIESHRRVEFNEGAHWFCWNGADLPILEGECAHIMVTCARGGEERILSELARILPFGGIALVEVGGRDALAALLAAGSALDIAAVLPMGNPGRQRYLYALERIVEEELIPVHSIS